MTLIPRPRPALKRTLVLSILAAALTAGAALDAPAADTVSTTTDSTTTDSTTTDAATTAPAVTPSAPNPAVSTILDRLEKKGDTVDAIEAKITFTKIDPVLEDKQIYKGILRFKKTKPNPRFFIRFDVLKHEGIVSREAQWHVFDGQWYIETRDTSNVITKRQIVRPGEPCEAFKIGQGPFPLPFGQKKADIIRHFDITLLPSKTGDPKHSDHLACTPRPGTELAEKYDTVHFYINRKLDLPVRVSTVEKKEGTRIIASFEDVRVNPSLKPSDLALPKMPDKQIETIPLAPPRTGTDAAPRR